MFCSREKSIGLIVKQQNEKSTKEQTMFGSQRCDNIFEWSKVHFCGKVSLDLCGVQMHDNNF